MLNLHRLRAALALTVVGLWAVSIAVADHGDSKGGGQAGGNVVTRHHARLSGADLQGKTPEGDADFRSESATARQRLNVEVEHVNLPAQTILDVVVSHGGVASTIGHITLSALGEGELELNSQDGATVPTVQTGDVVTVMNGAAAIVAGVFN